MIRLFEILRENEYLARFSFTDFHGCSIATIIILLHGILERDATYEATINFAFESLRYMATDNETARLRVKFVDGFKSLADEAVDKMRAASGMEYTDGSKNESGGYESWLEWMTSAAPQPQPAVADDVPGIQDPLDRYLDRTIGYQATDMELGSGVALQFDQAGDLMGNLNTDANAMSGMYNFDDSFILGFTGLDVLISRCMMNKCISKPIRLTNRIRVNLDGSEEISSRLLTANLPDSRDDTGAKSI
jgi:hypothetical protein